jgi:hypothetical protein
MQYLPPPRSVPSLSQSVVPIATPRLPSRHVLRPPLRHVLRPPLRHVLRPPSAFHRQLSPPASHTITSRLSIQILHPTSNMMAIMNDIRYYVR